MANHYCKECNTIDPKSEIVHSGTDGFMLMLDEGQLYNICYDCGNKHRDKKLAVMKQK